MFEEGFLADDCWPGYSQEVVCDFFKARTKSTLDH